MQYLDSNQCQVALNLMTLPILTDEIASCYCVSSAFLSVTEQPLVARNFQLAKMISLPKYSLFQLLTNHQGMPDCQGKKNPCSLHC